MELPLHEAKARLSELIAAAQVGECVVITKHGQPAVELVRFRKRGGVDFEKLALARARLGLKKEGKGWTSDLDDSALERRAQKWEPVLRKNGATKQRARASGLIPN